MKHRSPAAVFLLSLITFGIYAFVWHVKTKNELNRLGAHIPTAWLLIVPLANLYWIWKYCEGVEQVSQGQISAVLALILLLLLSIVGLAIIQSEYNKLSLQPAGPVPGPGAMPQPQQFGTATVNPSQPGPVPPTYPAQPADNDPTGPPTPPPAPPAPPAPPLPPSPIQ